MPGSDHEHQSLLAGVASNFSGGDGRRDRATISPPPLSRIARLGMSRSACWAQCLRWRAGTALPAGRFHCWAARPTITDGRVIGAQGRAAGASPTMSPRPQSAIRVHFTSLLSAGTVTVILSVTRDCLHPVFQTGMHHKGLGYRHSDWPSQHNRALAACGPICMSCSASASKSPALNIEIGLAKIAIA